MAWSKVRDALADAQGFFPADAGEAELTVNTTAAQTVLVALRWGRDDDPQLGMMSRLAEDLENRLRNVSGTKETEIFGEAEEEIRVVVDPDEVAAANLTVSEISTAIAQADTKSPAGQARGQRTDLAIEIGDDLTSVDRVRRVPLRTSGDGEVLRVGDIASVTKDVRDPPSTIALVSGERAVAVGATAEPDQRVDLWAQRARGVIDDFAAELPGQIVVETIFDQSLYTEQRLTNLTINLAIGAFIVVAVLIVTMGLRSALLVGSALPLTFAMVLAQMNALGVDLHQISVTGLIVSLGLLIDNAIVVTDEFNQYRAKGFGIAEAVGKAVRRLVVPLFASTSTTVLAFAPIAFAPGAVGQFVGTIGLSVILCVTSSYFLAMTVIPAIAGFIDQRAGRAVAFGEIWWRDGLTNERLLKTFSGVLDFVIRRPWAGIGLASV
ncbi:MAG: efflux RND transporter permease subunit, partial [Phycisphaerales bacterium]|nr:efflux RND transporter permease subunit [Phycisphaerales bacterium]